MLVQVCGVGFKGGVLGLKLNANVASMLCCILAPVRAYVVKDNIMNEVIQISNKTDAGWIVDKNITNPYIPK